ncbi:hypothetical protein AB1N83_013238 [Pleurotus pulmonarius]
MSSKRLFIVISLQSRTPNTTCYLRIDLIDYQFYPSLRLSLSTPSPSPASSTRSTTASSRPSDVYCELEQSTPTFSTPLRSALPYEAPPVNYIYSGTGYKPRNHDLALPQVMVNVQHRPCRLRKHPSPAKHSIFAANTSQQRTMACLQQTVKWLALSPKPAMPSLR